MYYGFFCVQTIMVRKRRTELPSGGESSQSQQEASGSGSGRGYQQRAAEGSAPPQQQQGGGYQGGRGWAPQGGRGGYDGGRGGYDGGRGGYGGGRGGPRPPPQQQYGGAPPEYQGRGRGGPPQQGGRGGYGVGGRGGVSGGRSGGPSSGGPSPQDPALRQAIQVPHHPGVVLPEPTPSEASSSTQPPDVSQLAQQVEQLDIQEGASSQAIQPVPQTSKAMRFPLRPGKGSTGARCIVKANHFFAELPDKDLHQYDVSHLTIGFVFL